jgi:hypothetical protein
VGGCRPRAYLLNNWISSEKNYYYKLNSDNGFEIFINKKRSRIKNEFNLKAFEKNYAGCIYFPTKSIQLCVLSWIKNINGRSHLKSYVTSLGLGAQQPTITIAVAAAASVPCSLTSTTAWCITLDIWSSFFELIPPKSASSLLNGDFAPKAIKSSEIF